MIQARAANALPEVSMRGTTFSIIATAAAAGFLLCGASCGPEPKTAGDAGASAGRPDAASAPAATVLLRRRVTGMMASQSGAI